MRKFLVRKDGTRKELCPMSFPEYWLGLGCPEDEEEEGVPPDKRGCRVQFEEWVRSNGFLVLTESMAAHEYMQGTCLEVEPGDDSSWEWVSWNDAPSGH